MDGAATERDTKGADRLKISEEIAYTCRKANLEPWAFVLQFWTRGRPGSNDAEWSAGSYSTSP
jgi:hypothetical protein